MSNARNLAGIVTETPSTGSLSLPAGTTAQRPGTPAEGMIRQNTDTDIVETYNGTLWIAVGDQAAIYSAEYLVVAGGGGGGNTAAGGGGGGAGGYISTTSNFTASSAYTVTIGAGGAGSSLDVGGVSGQNSVFNSTTATAGVVVQQPLPMVCLVGLVVAAVIHEVVEPEQVGKALLEVLDQ